MNDFEMIAAVQLTRLSTGSGLFIRFDEPIHFTSLKDWVDTNYSTWALYFVYSLEDIAGN